ncbi:MAG: glycosyltransferase family 39 protein [Bacteroidales bacterium]|nr:glycosyltransferase family 39 protein [Bacteroidales bacterium]
MLAAWWVVNILQGAFMELADDEAYYWAWANHDGGLDWGYYDHPPMVAVLIWLSTWMGGSLGVRFATLLLQPLYLWLLWTMIRPSSPTFRHALVYAALCFALPALQLYGILSLPDAPLLMFSVLFLWSYRRMLRCSSVGNALLMGLSMALLAYSKYHGALVVAFALLANMRLLRKWQTYLAVAVTLVLITPHLLWLWQHDWMTLSYHLGERHHGFSLENPLMFVVNLLLFFNPLLVPVYWKALVGVRGAKDSHDDEGQALEHEWRRALCFVAVGFVLFFFVASLRGSTQAQWLLPMAVSLVALTFGYLDDNPRWQRYTLRVSAVTAALFIVARIVIIVNPFGIKGELWDNQATYARIAQEADGRPIVFSDYATAGKYAFYAGGRCSCQSVFYSHRSQWELWQYDTAFLGQTVLFEVHDSYTTTDIPLANGRTFHYKVVDDFRPIRNVKIDFDENRLDIGGDTLRCQLELYNPYPYNIATGEHDSIHIRAFFRLEQRVQPSVIDDVAFVLPAGDTTTLDCAFEITEKVRGQKCTMGFMLKSHQYYLPRQSKTIEMEF